MDTTLNRWSVKSVGLVLDNTKPLYLKDNIKPFDLKSKAKSTNGRFEHYHPMQDHSEKQLIN